MSAEDNKATLRRMIAAFNQRDLAFIDEAFSPHFVLHTALTPGWPRGLEGARKMFTAMFATAPDVQGTIEDMVAEGEKVAIRWTFRGTHTGEPPLNLSVRARKPIGVMPANWHAACDWATLRSMPLRILPPTRTTVNAKPRRGYHTQRRPRCPGSVAT
jgi:predicted ester cyclase